MNEIDAPKHTPCKIVCFVVEYKLVKSKSFKYRLPIELRTLFSKDAFSSWLPASLCKLALFYVQDDN